MAAPIRPAGSASSRQERGKSYEFVDEVKGSVIRAIIQPINKEGVQARRPHGGGLSVDSEKVTVIETAPRTTSTRPKRLSRWRPPLAFQGSLPQDWRRPIAGADHEGRSRDPGAVHGRRVIGDLNSNVARSSGMTGRHGARSSTPMSRSPRCSAAPRVSALDVPGPRASYSMMGSTAFQGAVQRAGDRYRGPGEEIKRKTVDLPRFGSFRPSLRRSGAEGSLLA